MGGIRHADAAISRVALLPLCERFRVTPTSWESNMGMGMVIVADLSTLHFNRRIRTTSSRKVDAVVVGAREGEKTGKERLGMLRMKWPLKVGWV